MSNVCACGHWSADHIGKTGPCAARVRKPAVFGFGWTIPGTCACDAFAPMTVVAKQDVYANPDDRHAVIARKR